MTGTFRGDGRSGLPVGQPDMAEAAGEAVLIDRLIELVLAFEPIEHKQTGAPADLPLGRAAARAEAGGSKGEGGADGAGQAAASDAAAPGLTADSTQAMLERMRLVLDREAARLGEDGLEGKPAVDQVALIARTLEKIDQMERLIAEDRAKAESQTLSAGERDELRQTVRQLILAAAERLTAERLAGQLAGERVGETNDGGNPAQGTSDPAEA